MAEGKIVYQGPRDDILEFFDRCGFKCPFRKGVADFLQEVISMKDQEQYCNRSQQTYSYISVDEFSRKYKEYLHGHKLSEELALPFDKSKGDKNAMNFIQLVMLASAAMTVFLRTQMRVDLLHANKYLGALFFSLIIIIVDGLPKLSMTVARLSVFYKQRDLHFYPAWAYAVPATILKIPLSLLVVVVWTSFTYYSIGYSQEAGRFFCQMIVFFAVHFMSISLFHFVAAVFRTMPVYSSAGSLITLFVMITSGFMIKMTSMPTWLRWAFWVSPLSYAEISLTLNEFLAPRWQKVVLCLDLQCFSILGLHFP